MFTETQPTVIDRLRTEALHLRRLQAAAARLAHRRMQHAAAGNEDGVAGAALLIRLLERDVIATRARIDALLDDATATAGRDGGI